MERIKGFANFRMSDRLKELGSLKFSESVKKSHRKRIENPRTEIVNWKGNTISKNPIHLVPQNTLDELLKVKSFIQSKGEAQARSDAERYDNGMLDKFEYICSNIGLEFNREYFRELKNEIGDFMISEKYRWNIPRPYQVAEFMNIPFGERYITKSTVSPTYPSSHAGSANLIAEVLSKIYPNHSDRFFRLANLISLSRISAGVHFFPDIEEGRRIAQELVSKNLIKLPTEYKNNLKN